MLDALLQPLSQNEVVDAYRRFEGFSVASKYTSVQLEVGREGDVVVSIDLFDSEKRSLMRRDRDEHLLLKRRWLAAWPLRADEGNFGKVVFNEMTCFRDDARHRGLGRALVAHEDGLFRRWGASEIQLNVGCEARKSGVWHRLGFVPSSRQRRFLEQLWSDYAEENGIPAAPLPVAWSEWDKGFRDECVVNSIPYLQMVRCL